MNSSKEHHEGVVYWYGAPFATLNLTDELNVCNSADNERHHYESATAEPPYELTSRYEWGPDTDFQSDHSGGKEGNISSELYFPAESDSVRIMHGSSSFVVNIDPENLGVLLRRKFDYQYPNQKAQIWVKNAEADTEWQLVYRRL